MSGLLQPDFAIELHVQLQSRDFQRDAANLSLWDKVKRVRAGVKASFGNDLSQYEMLGGTRVSERKTAARRTTAFTVSSGSAPVAAVFVSVPVAAPVAAAPVAAVFVSVPVAAPAAAAPVAAVFVSVPVAAPVVAVPLVAVFVSVPVAAPVAAVPVAAVFVSVPAAAPVAAVPVVAVFVSVPVAAPVPLVVSVSSYFPS